MTKANGTEFYKLGIHHDIYLGIRLWSHNLCCYGAGSYQSNPGDLLQQIEELKALAILLCNAREHSPDSSLISH